VGGENGIGNMNRRVLTALLIAAAALGCDRDGGLAPDERAEFLFALRGLEDRFVAVTSDSSVIEKARAQLQRPVAQRELFISGSIARGNGGHNLDWSWHFVPDQWDLVEVAVEVCDGTPQEVEADLDYWVDQLGRFCPYRSYVAAEL
jgi:hypothetical protein